VKRTQQGLTLVLRIVIKMRNQDYVVLCKTIWKWFENLLIFWEVNLTRTCPTLTYLHSQWRIKDHVVL